MLSMLSHASRRLPAWLIFDVSQDMHLSRYILPLVIAQLSGCAVMPRSESKPAAVFRSGWECTITHVGANAISSAIFAVANHNIAISLREEFQDFKVEGFLAPHPQGYDVVILSERPLASSQSDTIAQIVFRSVDDARSDRPMYEPKKRANKALEPTTTSVTSPASAGAAPAVVVAHL